MVDGGDHDEMKPIALEYGGDDRDPWPRLLEKCQELDAQRFDDAVDIARLCLENRRNAVAEARCATSSRLTEERTRSSSRFAPPAPPGSPQYLARRLKSVVSGGCWTARSRCWRATGGASPNSSSIFFRPHGPPPPVVMAEWGIQTYAGPLLIDC